MNNPTEKTAREWGWGIIGTGNIANKFADDLHFAPGAKRAAVYSRKVETAQAFADAQDFLRAYDDLDSFLGDDAIDIVYIATPHTVHVEQALACINAGKATLIEKPIAMTSDEVKAIQDAAVQKGVFVMEGLWSRFLPAIQRAKAMLDGGALGKPIRAEVSLQYERSYDPEDRLFAPELGGGVLHDLGVYPISICSYLFGTPQLTESKWFTAPNGVNAHAQFTLKCNGVTVAVETSLMKTGENCLVIYCEKGVLRLDRHFLRAKRITIWKGVRTSVPSMYPALVDRIRYKLGLHGGKTQRFERMGTGLHYQAAAVQAALGQELISHPVMPLEQSAMALDIIAEILDNPAVGPCSH